jgi:hypothetical protein
MEHPMDGLLRISILISFSLVIASCCVAADTHATRNEGVLEGTWQASVSDSQLLVLTIENSRIELTAEINGTKEPSWTGKMSISKDSPKQHMDLIELSCGEKKLPDNKCLFRLRGDTLLIIGGGPNKRPSRFDSGPGSDPKTLVFFRVDSAKEQSVPSDVSKPPVVPQ